ncbi:hypothetical protein J5X07_01090 [Actinomyces bowdenii]|uniref:DUF5979 domain-containing protein n=1 Tax=Actinomyces bowdenii TaxID=131109 RepID=A0A3P1V5I1_9ACTO|nr:DUF5979 domain-containing protein [Actinomyces bowdenii]MBO3723638.1 hypothetical protein [Actinomyces bowdenii]RRD29058.1 hypothetical protein EII10_08205 [Actinomyces bowdenii]
MGLTARLRGALDRHRFVLVVFVGAMVVLLAVVIPARAQAVRTGDLQVSVRVTGAPAALVRDYLLDYTCTDGQAGTVSARGSGAPTLIEGAFPVGTRCTVMADAEELALPGYVVEPEQGREAAGSSVVIAGTAGGGPTPAVVEIDYRAAR